MSEILNFLQLASNATSKPYSKRKSVETDLTPFLWQSLNTTTLADFENQEIDVYKPTKDACLKLLFPLNMGKKYRGILLSKFYAFVDTMKWMLKLPGDTALVHICQTSPVYLNVFKSPKDVHKIIQVAKRVSLLKCIDNSFHFSTVRTPKALKKCYSKTYAMNLKMLRFLCSIFEDLKQEYGINKYVNGTHNVEQKYSDEELMQKYNIDLQAGMRIANAPDEQIERIIEKKYPQIQWLKQQLDYINNRFYKDDPFNKLHFKLNIHRSKMGFVTRISCRVTNPFSYSLHSWENFKAKHPDATDEELLTFLHEQSNKLMKEKRPDLSVEECELLSVVLSNKLAADRMWREDYINQQYGDTMYSHWDKKASVPTLLHYKATGEYETGDAYAKMFNINFKKDCGDDAAKVRNFCKSLTLRLVFDYSASAVWSKFNSLKLFDKFDEQYKEKSKLDEFGTTKRYSKQLTEKFYNTVQKYVHNVHKNTSIFLDESCIMVSMLRYLLENDYKCFLCYDSIWAGKDECYIDKETYNKLHHVLTRHYFKKWYNISESTSNINP